MCVTEVRCSWGGTIQTSDARPLYSVNLLNLELCEGMRLALAGITSRCNRGAAVEADAIGEQLKQTQSGSSSSSTESCSAPDYSRRRTRGK